MESQRKTDQEITDIHSECVKEEFYKWFENRGLLFELRAYMRQLMVKALEESNSKENPSMKRKAASSPKLQAINLLLVDYLFHEDYLYTVSVFASEAQILESLPQYSRYVSETVRQHRRDPSCLPRFSRQETEDILDTLRLPPSRRDMEQAIQLYLSGHESLLTCVARTLASEHTTSSMKCTGMEWAEVIQGSGGQQLWSNEMQNLLLMAGVKIQHIQRMQHKWQCIIEEERRKSREDSEKEQLIQQAEWEEKLREEVREELGEEQISLQVRKRELNELGYQLSEVHQDVKERMAQLQEQSEDLQEREEGLQRREMQQQIERHLLEQRLNNIQAREEHLKLTMISLTEQSSKTSCRHVDASTQLRNEVTTSGISIQVCESAIPGPQVKPAPMPGPQVVSSNTQTVNTANNEQQTSSSLEIDAHFQRRLQTEREKINELQEENMELRAYALQQRQRIDDLTNRAASLSAQLEESQMALTLLSGRESEQPAPLTVAIPPLPPSQNAFVAPTFGFNAPQRQGAGEESLFTPRRQQALPRSDGRKRPSRFAFSNNPNPTSEDSSPTDEVVQNARARIQQLEAESIAVQRSYQAFQTRLLNTDSVMFPPLNEHPRSADPFLRVRRFDVTPFVPLPSNPPHFHTNLQQESHIQSPEEDNGSSSDQSLFFRPGRIENFANSRRLFTERNIRHFERWKQYKKKFQRRTDFDRNIERRNNTSSDDDESYRTPRRRNEINKAKHSKQDNTSGNQETNRSTNAFDILRNRTDSTGNHQELLRKEKKTEHENIPICKTNENEPHTRENSAVSSNNETKEDKLKSEIEQSMKLIESVKILLEAQNLNPIGTGTFSNDSLLIESLPKDSDDNTQNETAISNSALTVKILDPVIQEITDKKNDGERRDLFVTGNISQSQDHLDFEKSLLPKINQKGSEMELEEESRDREHSPLPLNMPNSRLVPLGLNTTVEDRFTSTEVAGQGEVETSITSASDILRELNPSKDSSDSLVSIGNDSHSEDFWN